MDETLVKVSFMFHAYYPAHSTITVHVDDMIKRKGAER